MTKSLVEIERKRVLAAEKCAIAGIPAWMVENARKANEKFAAEGGCVCGSKRIGVHYHPCSWSNANPDLY